MKINITNGSIEYDGEPILTEINFTVNEKDRIALVGRNGCGKTSLLKALTGEVEMVEGTGEEKFSFSVTRDASIGYLKQISFDDENRTLTDEVLSSYQSLLDLQEKLNASLEKLQNDATPGNISEYSRLHELFEFSGGYTYQTECKTAIKKFGFSDEEANKPLNCFSGGQRTKIALLKLLLSKPDLLLLDEPTNHLDVEAVTWLEGYLKNYKNAFIVVSHDRFFLDKVANVVYEIEYGETHRYKGNYTNFTVLKRQEYDKAMRDAVIKKREIERLQKIVDKFRYKAGKAAMAQAKLSQIKRIGQVDEPRRYDEKTFKSDFKPLRDTVRKTVVIDKLVFGYNKPLGEISAIVEAGDKIGIIGANGTGKSTLIKTVVGNIPQISGKVNFGVHTDIGYFEQTLAQTQSENTVLYEFQKDFPSFSDTEARTKLGAFLLTGEDVFKRVCDLSGGEKVRFALGKIMYKRPNLLLLDEPTNHLDIVGKETFENMLASYTGTIMVVSHDRYLINKICNRLIVFEKNGPIVFDGTYEEYLDKKEAVIVEEKKENLKEKKQKTVGGEKENRKREHRIAVLEEKINALDKEISLLNERLNFPEIACDYVKILEIEKQLEALNENLLPLMEEWETLSVLNEN